MVGTFPCVIAMILQLKVGFSVIIIGGHCAHYLCILQMPPVWVFPMWQELYIMGKESDLCMHVTAKLIKPLSFHF
jgi:hypothetical protein